MLKMLVCRSRKGAWIEIAVAQANAYAAQGRSRKGAWIEMQKKRPPKRRP